jgi:geranylgeranyl pyrophosphate synthase
VASSSRGATFGFDFGAAFVLVDSLVDVFEDEAVLGAVFVSEPQPDSTIANAAAIAAVP